MCDRCSRGGPAVRRSPSVYPNVGFNWDDRSRVSPYYFLNLGRGDEGRAHFVEHSVGADIRPTSAMQVSASADITNADDDGQYYGTFSDVDMAGACSQWPNSLH